jgi:hypothetical protein
VGGCRQGGGGAFTLLDGVGAGGRAGGGGEGAGGQAHVYMSALDAGEGWDRGRGEGQACADMFASGMGEVWEGAVMVLTVIPVQSFLCIA